MSLSPITLKLKPLELESNIEDLLSRVDERIEAFAQRGADANRSGFVPSDFPLVYQGLRAIREQNLATGDVFCEWGSGFGVAAMLASQLGFQATGIEISEDLVDEASDIAEEFSIDVEFACGTFVPHMSQEMIVEGSLLAWLSQGGQSGYDLLEIDPEEVDLFFAFPWPGEADSITEVFDAHAGSGALLLTYNGIDELKLMRKD